jgi:hypothetical protein
VRPAPLDVTVRPSAHAIEEERHEQVPDGHGRASEGDPAEQRAIGLVKVAVAQNEVEAGFLQGLLREEGIPSAVRRSAGFDVPEFLAAGPRDILVSPSDRQPATELLAPQPEAVPPEDDQGLRPVHRTGASRLESRNGGDRRSSETT